MLKLIIFICNVVWSNYISDLTLTYWLSTSCMFNTDYFHADEECINKCRTLRKAVFPMGQTNWRLCGSCKISDCSAGKIIEHHVLYPLWIIVDQWFDFIFLWNKALNPFIWCSLICFLCQGLCPCIGPGHPWQPISETTRSFSRSKGSYISTSSGRHGRHWLSFVLIYLLLYMNCRSMSVSRVY